jgi:hypothetical protein
MAYDFSLLVHGPHLPNGDQWLDIIQKLRVKDSRKMALHNLLTSSLKNSQAFPVFR